MKRKIAIFTGLNIQDYGGGEKYAIAMSNNLKNFEITFFSYETSGKHRLSKKQANELTKSKIIYYNAIELPILNERIPTKLPSLQGFDVIYDYDPSLATLGKLKSVANELGIRLIFGMHSPASFRETPVKNTPSRATLLKLYSPLRDTVILSMPEIRVINSEDVAILRNKGFEGVIHEIPDFLDVNISKKDLTINRKEFIVLWVGRLNIEHKGLDILNEIIKSTPSDITFHIIGSGDNGESLMEEIITKHKNVKWLGFVAEEKLTEEYKKASLFLSTSRYESFGLNLGEAQAYGIPAIAFNVKGSKDILIEDFQGKLIEPFNITRFANGIKEYKEKWIKGEINVLLKKKISSNILKRYGKKTILPLVEEMFA